MYLGALSVSASVNKQVVDLSEELARKVEDSLRQQEEISSLLAQIVDLQARCKGVRGARTHTSSEDKVPSRSLHQTVTDLTEYFENFPLV